MLFLIDDIVLMIWMAVWLYSWGY